MVPVIPVNIFIIAFLQECDNKPSFVTKESFKINHYFESNSKCLIYLVSCKVCGKQYVRSTTERLRFRWKNCKDNEGKAK